PLLLLADELHVRVVREQHGVGLVVLLDHDALEVLRLLDERRRLRAELRDGGDGRDACGGAHGARDRVGTERDTEAGCGGASKMLKVQHSYSAPQCSRRLPCYIHPYTYNRSRRRGGAAPAGRSSPPPPPAPMPCTSAAS